MIKEVKYYLKVWLLMSRYAIAAWASKKKIAALFLTGKVIRYILSLSFLYLLVKNTNGLLTYSKEQVVFFALTFILIDTTSQLLFRSVYTFKQLVVTGDFDQVLIKPINALFRSLMGGLDPIDMVTLPPIVFAVCYIGSFLHPNILHVIYYIILVINSLFISAALHISVLSFGLITFEVDNLMLILRDIMSMGRFPVDIYKGVLSGVLNFVVPVGVMMTIPAKSIMGILSVWGVLGSMFVGGILFYLSLQLWQFALKKYTSASS